MMSSAYRANRMCAKFRAIHASNGQVETSLGTVAFAEPRGCWGFRPSALTEPAWSLVLVSPSEPTVRNCRNGLPQIAFVRPRGIRSSDAAHAQLAARTMDGLSASPREAGGADCAGAGRQPTVAARCGEANSAYAYSGAGRSTGRSRATSPKGDAVARVSANAGAGVTIHGCGAGTSGNSSRWECGSGQTAPL